MPVSQPIRLILLAFILYGGSAKAGQSGDMLSGWRDAPAKTALIGFVSRITDSAGELFVPPQQRIAVFDNDGTLWPEAPWPVPVEFVFFRIRQLAPDHPEWHEQYPYKAVVSNDVDWLSANSRAAFRELSPVAQAGMTTGQYEQYVRQFIATARHPDTGLRYSEMLYAPMLELIKFLQNNQFKVYVVSGGDLDFIRAYAPAFLGIPRENIIGSHPAYGLKVNGTDISIVRKPESGAVNVGGFKVLNIHLHIGQRPVMAFGNSDGDLQMLRYAAANEQPFLAAVIEHDDGERELDDRSGAESLLAEAEERGWLRISLKRDFVSMFIGDED